MSIELFFIVFIATVAISRILSEIAIKKLTIEQKASLVDSFSSLRTYWFIPAAIIVILYFALTKYTAINVSTLAKIFYSFSFVYLLTTLFIVFKKLKALSLPVNIYRLYGAAISIHYFGVITLLVLLVIFNV